MNKFKQIITHIESINIVIISTLFSLFWYLLAHGMTLTNKYSFHDDIFLFHSGTAYSSGRWFLGFLSHLNELLFWGNISLPLFNGFIGFAFLSASQLLIIKMLNLSKATSVFGLTGIMCVFPVICGMLGYNFTYPYYMISLFLSTLSVYLITLNKPTYFLIGIVFAACSVGIYQAFIPFLLSLLLIEYITELTNHEKDLTDSAVYIQAIKRIIFSTCFILLYALINKITLKILNYSLSDYDGISSIENNTVIVYLSRIKSAYREYIYPLDLRNYTLNTMFHGPVRYLYYITIIALLFLSIASLCKAKKKQIRFILVLCYLCLPLCINFIFVMSDISIIHNLMLYSQCLLFVMLLTLCEKLYSDKHLICYAAGIFVITICFLYCKYDNSFYLKAEVEQQRTIEYFSRLVSRIQSVPGYSENLRVAWVNSPGENDDSLVSLHGFEKYRMYPYYGARELVSDYSWTTFLDNWCGYHMDIDLSTDFKTNIDVINMPHYPDDGSIKIIDNTIVIKF